MSERDGWAHLYLYDGATGQVKNQITKGEWPVHNVERVDEAKRQIYFTANGMDAGKDPYLINYFRDQLRRHRPHALHEGRRLPRAEQRLGRSRVLRRHVLPRRHAAGVGAAALSGSVARDDARESRHHRSDGRRAGRCPKCSRPRAATAGRTSGAIIIKPTNFDPTKKYPVIENIYAGPQGSFVPKTVQHADRHADDGRARVHRRADRRHGDGESIEGVSRRRPGRTSATPDFPDRILWHKAVAAKYPWYDTTRVGIYGTSAGGQNAAGAVIFHPEFYKAAASFAGLPRQPHGQDLVERAVDGLADRSRVLRFVEYRQRLQTWRRRCCSASARWTPTSIRRRRCRW